MNSKILIAFAAGALLASGIVYMAVKDEAQPKTAAAPVAVPLPGPPEAAAPKVPEPVAVVPPAIPPVRQKPSPMSAPVRREKPVVVAVRHDPPPPPAPEPVREEAADQQPDPKPPVEAQIPNEPPPAPPVAEDPAPPPEQMPEVRTPHTVTIAAGTFLPVRIGETLSASRNRSGDGFLATLDKPLVVDGFVIAERGSRVEGRVVEAMKGESRLEIELVKLSTSDGQHIQIRTEAFRKAESSAGSDVAKVGLGAALGAAIGGAAAGGKGAAIGAGAGAAAGVAGVALSRRTAEIPVETRIRFRMSDPVTITERLD